ncbi:F0F1 ATP synthase subunit A [Dactylosporangium siamense]|uniref:F0F1 ATP synthase subunit A n=1 Tax=Dactylosporangium siamense TaxID=685454 RepID=UPI001943BE8C|nr:F0F1 ATP synthase subunit A [Dactylosporangium siamense]
MSGLVLAEVPFPPSVDDIFPPSLWESAPEWLTKFSLFLWLAVAVVLIYFLVSYRDPKIVPTKKQWLAESIYGFVREGVAKDVIGHEGLRFAPYLASLFCFILVGNIFSIVPLIQVSPNAHIAFPAVLALSTYGLYLYQGFKKHGFVGYLKHATVLPAPWFMQPLLLPIEALQAFILQPVTLALRLFANMFAGHMLLLVFTLGGFALLNAESLFLKPVALVSWAMTIALTFFELLIAALQAYVFTLLTANYLAGTLAEEH